MSQMDPTTNRHAGDPPDDDEEIDLEPTIHQPGGWPTTSAPSFHMALNTGSIPSLTTHTEELRRTRLKAAALFLALGYAVFLIFGLIDPGSSWGKAVLPL